MHPNIIFNSDYKKKKNLRKNQKNQVKIKFKSQKIKKYNNFIVFLLG